MGKCKKKHCKKMILTGILTQKEVPIQKEDEIESL
jgi:hypothetical protein